MSTTLLALEQLFNQAIGDDLEFDTTTNITTNTSVISTTLTSYDGGQDDYFNGWWVYITEGNNITVHRQISDYATATGTLTVRGANLAAESGAVTCRLHRYNRDTKTNAIKRAVEQLYPTLHKPLDNQTLVGGNIIPNGHFEGWASSSYPDFHSVTNATAAATTTAGLFRGGATSAKVTASAANGYMCVDSNNYPPLLDLMAKTVSVYVWAYPEVANDAFITIYTLQADGTAQTLSSTTTCPAAAWTLLKLESQALNDDLVRVQIRFRVATNAKYAYFDDAICCGMSLSEYVLPSDFQDGHVNQVMVQVSGDADKPCHDLAAQNWTVPFQFRIDRNSEYSPPTTYHKLRIGGYPNDYYRIRLIGYKPLEALSSDSATIYLDGEKLNLIVAKAATIFYRAFGSPVSSQDKSRYFNDIAMWENEVTRLTYKFFMATNPETTWTGG